jgi:hypothetical protein
MAPEGFPGLIKLCVKASECLCVLVFSLIAQHTLNATIMTWPRLELVPCGTTAFAELDIETSIHLPGHFSYKFEPYDVRLSAMVNDTAGRLVKCSLGSTAFPEMALNRGDNAVDVDVRASLDDPSTLISTVINPMFVDGKNLELHVDVDNVTVHVLGLTLPKLKLHKVLSCRALNISTSPGKLCSPSTTSWLEQVAGKASESSLAEDLVEEMLSRRLQSNVKSYIMECEPSSSSLLPHRRLQSVLVV